ncbi:MAG: hypothetical protein WBE72_08250 [Terracidiphilus sp.]
MANQISNLAMADVAHGDAQHAEDRNDLGWASYDYPPDERTFFAACQKIS